MRVQAPHSAHRAVLIEGELQRVVTGAHDGLSTDEASTPGVWRRAARRPPPHLEETRSQRCDRPSQSGHGE